MKHLELEKELTAKIRRRRLIEIGITAVWLFMGIVFAALYENSKVYEESFFGGLRVTDSNMALYWLMAGSFMAAAVCALVPCLDFLYSKFVTVEACGAYITVYRGLLKNYLYENGKCIASGAGYWLKATLTDRTRMTVSFGKWSSHITFSNDHPPIDI